MTLSVFCLIYLILGSICGLAIFLGVKAIDKMPDKYIEENRGLLNQFYTEVEIAGGLPKVLILFSLVWPLFAVALIVIEFKRLLRPNTPVCLMDATRKRE